MEVVFVAVARNAFALVLSTSCNPTVRSNNALPVLEVIEQEYSSHISPAGTVTVLKNPGVLAAVTLPEARTVSSLTSDRIKSVTSIVD